MRQLSLLCVLACTSALCNAQPPKNATTNIDSIPDFYRYYFESEKHFSILTGYNGWSANHWTVNYAEIGVALNDIGRYGYHAADDAYFFSSDFRNQNNKWIVGPKIGGWFAGGVAAMALGLNIIYYTDLTGGTLRTRPEIGFGFAGGKIVYGYNIKLTNGSFAGINTNLITLCILIGVKKIKVTRKETANWNKTDASILNKPG